LEIGDEDPLKDGATVFRFWFHRDPAVTGW